MDNTIEAHGLVKRFGDTTALDGVDLAARTGSVLAVLGPNGAGKTTAVRILATLLEPDEGRARVGGYDGVAQAQQVRFRMEAPTRRGCDLPPASARGSPRGSPPGITRWNI